MATVDLLAADKFPKAAVRFAENRRQRNTLQSVFVFQLVAVQKLHRTVQLRDELLPLVTHLESRMGNGAEVAAVGLRRDDLVADVEQRVHQPAVGAVHKNENEFAHGILELCFTRPVPTKSVRCMG